MNLFRKKQEQNFVSDKSWSEELSLDTSTIMVELDDIEQSQLLVKKLSDVEAAQQKSITRLTAQSLKLTKALSILAEKVKWVQEETDKHNIVLFAVTDKNDFGKRGLYHQATEIQRFGKWVVVCIVSLSGFIGWLLTYVLPVLVKLGGLP